MHSKLEKMRFQRLNENENASENKDKEFEGSHGIDDFKNEENDLNLNNQLNCDSSEMLTLEGLRRTYNSCSNCGVSWYDDHISLDCTECGGYAMCRPCPACNGQCGNKWRRDVKASHNSKHAEWHGTCSMNFQWEARKILESQIPEDRNANFQYLNNNYHSLPQTLMQGAQIRS